MTRRTWRGFGTAVALLAAALIVGGALAPPPAAAQKTVTLKMQATWPAGWTLYDNFTQFAERVNKLSGGRLKIETLPAGAIVPAFEVLDAVHKKVLDGGHSWAAYWVGKNKTAVLFTGGPGGTFGMDYIDAMGWLYEGGGLDLYNEFYRDVLKVNVVALPILPAGPQAFGWFKRPIKNLADFKGMKCRQTGMAAEVFTAMGMRTVNMPGGEILPAAERGLIDCAEWVAGIEDLKAGFHNIWKYHYTPGMHENVTIGELIINGDVWKSLAPDLQEIIKSAATETFFRWWMKWQRQNADALVELEEKHKVQILKTPDDILYEFLRTWDKIAKAESDKNPFFKKVWESQKAYASKVVPAKRFMFPNYDFAADHYWPVKKK
ncbi:MAG: TRAP transporter substrate-binding protein [Candidatus Rokubacteria bacterium]|nr:TRAP transporter substrate-binding protein [Candidatus Rokubacteria bacterium]